MEKIKRLIVAKIKDQGYFLVVPGILENMIYHHLIQDKNEEDNEENRTHYLSMIKSFLNDQYISYRRKETCEIPYIVYFKEKDGLQSFYNKEQSFIQQSASCEDAPLDWASFIQSGILNKIFEVELYANTDKELENKIKLYEKRDDIEILDIIYDTLDYTAKPYQMVSLRYRKKNFCF